MDDLARRIVVSNQQARLRASARMSRLIAITAQGTHDEFTRFLDEIGSEFNGGNDRVSEENGSPETVVGGFGDSLAGTSG